MAVDKVEAQSLHSVVLGTFEGECADSNITNLNGLDITREVWENVFNSDEYKRAIDLGWYIGYLGHPEDPNCMDFEHACIVMKEGHIDNDGKIYGKFDLIDTPVGRIVKSFQDAGVQFGISVRGAGDILDNSVDPDTFVFRGFDLVSFPAYPESVPTFVAASSDIETQQKYKAICAAVKANIDSIDNCEAIDILQSHFAKQSEEYGLLESRRNAIKGSDAVEDDIEDISEDKVMAMTKLYMEVIQANKQLVKEVELLRRELKRSDSSSHRKINSMKRIMSSQLSEMDNELNSITASLNKSETVNTKLRKRLTDIKGENLKYKQKIDSATHSITQKDSQLAKLRSDLRETVTASQNMKSSASNLDVENKRLKSELAIANKLIQDYQDAYAGIYANAIGVSLDNVTVTASTSVSELQKLIASRDNTMLNSPSTAPTPIDVIDDDELVTL